MLSVVFPFIGGIGLFLIGMMLLSEGLVAFAGGALQRALVRFAGTPYKAFVSGALVTALVQSSTATTVTLIGFVSAGLVGFAQAIGVVIGASLGNTATGWIVAGLGLKINLGFYTLPLIGVGAFLKLMTRGRWQGLGLALAGFGTLFLGLNMLQEGMQGLSGWFNLARLPAGGFWARLLVLLIGLVLTTVLQSSTAAIAMTLTALHAEAINFDQAASMVVGAAIGTTLTGALVTIGGTLYAKRTALAHILFNLMAGLIAVVLLPLFIGAIGWLERHAGLAPGATSLAAFHSLFILAGVAAVLPFSARFARLVERLLPEREADPASHLDASLLSIPAVALEASERVLEAVTLRLLTHHEGLLATPPRPLDAQELARLKRALDTSFGFISRVPLAGDDPLAAQRVAQLHASDHLLRLCERLAEAARTPMAFAPPLFAQALQRSRDLLARTRAGLTERCWPEVLPRIEDDAAALRTQSNENRLAMLADAGGFSGSAEQLLQITEGFRWLERAGHHVWRIAFYLAQGRAGAPSQVMLADAAERDLG